MYESRSRYCMRIFSAMVGVPHRPLLTSFDSNFQGSGVEGGDGGDVATWASVELAGEEGEGEVVWIRQVIELITIPGN